MGKTVNQRAGFTLVEVLLGVMLFSIISLSVYSVFSQGLRVEKRLRSSGIAGKDFYWPVHQIARDIGSMVSYSDSESQDGALNDEEGRLSFIIETKNGLEEVRYQIVEPERVDIHEVRVNTHVYQDASEVHRGRDEVHKSLVLLVRRSRPLAFHQRQSQAFQDEIVTSRLVDDGFKISYLHHDENGALVWNEEKGDQPVKAYKIDMTILDEHQMTRRMVRDIYAPAGIFKEGQHAP